MIIKTIPTCIPIKHHMIIKKHNLFVWNSTCWHQITRYGIWHLSSMAKVVPNCCIFYILFVGTFLKMFHSTRVRKSPHSPSKNSWTCCIYAHSMEILFVPPCCSPFFHSKSTFENGDFVRFLTSILWDLGVRPMIMIIQNVPYKKRTHVKTHKHG
jgi:hypothetical protein